MLQRVRLLCILHVNDQYYSIRALDAEFWVYLEQVGWNKHRAFHRFVRCQGGMYFDYFTQRIALYALISE